MLDADKEEDDADAETRYDTFISTNFCIKKESKGEQIKGEKHLGLSA